MNRTKIVKMIIASAIVAGSTCASTEALAEKTSNDIAICEESNSLFNNKDEENDKTKQKDESLNKTKKDLEVDAEEEKVENAEARATEKGKIVNVTTNVRVRAGAGTNFNTVGYLLNNTDISIISSSGDWYKISYGSLTGYVYKEYVKAISESSISSFQGSVVNISSYLNVRDGAGLDKGIIGHLKNGESVTVTGETGGWYIISFDGKSGYVSKDYIQKGNAASGGNSSSQGSQESGKVEEGKVINVSSSLNVRSGPATDKEIVGHLKNGESIDITGESGEFYKINYNGQAAYVSKEYVQKNNTNAETGSTGNATNETKENGTVCNVTTNLRVRKEASTSSTVLGYLLNNQEVKITGASGNFYQIDFNGQVGFVSKDYIKKGESAPSRGEENVSSEKSGFVTASVLNVRKGASTSSVVVGTLKSGATVKVQGSEGNFYKIEFNGSCAYVSKDYVTIGDSSISQSDKYSIVLENMKAHLGTPYCWGGYGQMLTTSSLNQLKNTFRTEAANGAYSRVSQYVDKGYRAFDCSGLMQWGFARAGVSIGRTTWDQVKNGYEVSLSNLKPGDLLFYSNLQHVGMYVGNGQWIESPNKNANIRIVNVPWNLIGRARRVI